ncbi:MAG: S-layer homology domain-containing protein [Cyanobacteria bacterium RM1_2_2]|nr:S-layer homology domain-containing protein [Cyanobacteria bacterium RM1_2_2]
MATLNPQFSDINAHWAEACILALAQRGLVRGYSDGRFLPDGTITRAEFAVLMFNAFPNAPPVRPAAPFPDVPASYWAYRPVTWAYERGFFSGYPDGSFQPTQPIPRMQAVLVLVTALGLQPSANTEQTLKTYFDDQVQVPDWTRWAVATAVVSDRLIVNFPDVRLFRPTQNATRAGVCAMLCRALNIADAVPLQYATWNIGIYEIKNETRVPFERWKGCGRLMRDIQTLLTPFRLFPAGNWITGKYDWQTEQALTQFCNFYGLPTMTAGVFDANFAWTLTHADPVDYLVALAKDRQKVYAEYLKREASYDANKLAFLDRGYTSSAYAADLAQFPNRILQKPDGQAVASTGQTATQTGTNQTVTFKPFPRLGTLPEIDTTALNFLSADIPQACVCVGSFVNGDIWTRWFGKNALKPAQMWSTTKIIPLLHVVDRANTARPSVKVRDCLVTPRGSVNGNGFYNLAVDLVSYRSSIGSSNSVAAMFKQFFTPAELEGWLKQMTGNASLTFQGRYGEDPLLQSPSLVEQASRQVVLNSPSSDHFGDNLISTYDLTRIMALLSWHGHLPLNVRIPGADWNSLETVVRAMGTDTARYLDVAIETLGLGMAIESPVIISKLGFGRSESRNRTELVYMAFIQFVDKRPRKQSKPGILRTVCMSLLAVQAAGDANDEARQVDARMAAEVTEILRRVVTQELI